MTESRLRAIVRFTMDPKHTPKVVRALREYPKPKPATPPPARSTLIAIVAAKARGGCTRFYKAFGQLPGVERTTSSIVLVDEFDKR